MQKFIGVLILALLAGCASEPPAPVPQPRGPASDSLDVFDAENLKIYTTQGFLLNQSFRDLVPLTYLEKYLDMRVAKTCAGLLDAEKKRAGSVPYLNRILVNPITKVPTADTKLYILVNDALLRVPKSPGIFYRGTHDCSFARDESGRIKEAFIERAFMSTSESKTAAEVFTHPKSLTPKAGVPLGCMMTIESASGRRVYDYTGNYNDEREVLFPMNVAFRLMGTPQVVGERASVTFKEIDPVIEKDWIEKLKTESYVQALKTSYADLIAENGTANPKKIESERKQLSEFAEYACAESLKFYSIDAKVRAKIDKASPAYNLKNKKLNPGDYSAPE